MIVHNIEDLTGKEAYASTPPPLIVALRDTSLHQKSPSYAAKMRKLQI
jgi:hypothetical protein